MIILKITRTEEGLAIQLSPEAEQVLGVADGQEIALELSDRGELVMAPLDMSFEARRERGRAFLRRYDKTFQALAK